MNWNLKEIENNGTGETIINELEFDTKKEARDYMNSRVKELKLEGWNTFMQETESNYFDKDLRRKEHIKRENDENDPFDIGDCGIYYYFIAELSI